VGSRGEEGGWELRREPGLRMEAWERVGEAGERWRGISSRKEAVRGSMGDSLVTKLSMDLAVV
jgi:hypothetical protein